MPLSRSVCSIAVFSEVRIKANFTEHAYEWYSQDIAFVFSSPSQYLVICCSLHTALNRISHFQLPIVCIQAKVLVSYWWYLYHYCIHGKLVLSMDSDRINGNICQRRLPSFIFSFSESFCDLLILMWTHSLTG